MPQCSSIKLHSETQVADRISMSGGKSPRHVQNPLSHNALLQTRAKILPFVDFDDRFGGHFEFTQRSPEFILFAMENTFPIPNTIRNKKN